MKKIGSVVIAISVIVILFVGYNVFKYTVKTITEREVKRITQEQVSKITHNEIERITTDETDRITEQEMLRITQEQAQQVTSSMENEEVKCDLKPKTREFAAQPYYSGSLIDSHVHMPVASNIVSSVAIQSGFEDMPHEGQVSLDYIHCLFKSEGISKLYGFFLVPNLVAEQSINSIVDITKKYPDTFIAFYMPTPIDSVNPSPVEVERIFDENEGLFSGIGEIKFAFDEVKNHGPLDPDYMELYGLAEKKNMIVMMHPASDHKDEVERIIKEYPKVKFLLHGGHADNWIIDVISKYPNVYYSIDATITSLYGFDSRQFSKSPTKEEWLKFMRKNFDSQLDKAVDQWKENIQNNPDRFLWGTDRWYGWQFDYKVGGLIEEFSRSFIGQLDINTQEKFAHKNAEKLLSKKLE